MRRDGSGKIYRGSDARTAYLRGVAEGLIEGQRRGFEDAVKQMMGAAGHNPDAFGVNDQGRVTLWGEVLAGG